MKKIFKGNISTYIISLSASAMGIILNFVLARILEAKSYGQIQYLIALSTTFSQFLVFGMTNYLIRESNNEKKKDIFNSCFSLFLCITLFGVPIMYYITKNDSSLNNISSILVIAVAVLMGLNSLISSYYHGRGKYKFSLVFENLLPKMSMLILAIVFFALSKLNVFEEWYLVFYIVAYSAIAIPLICINLRKIVLNISSEDFKSIIFFFGVTITYSLGNNLTKVFQGGLYKNEVALGVVSVSLSIISLIKVFTSVLDNIVKPIFARLKRENNNEKLLETYRFDTRVNSYFAIPLYLFFILHSKNFLYIFGESYTIYPFILTILSLANMVSDLTGPNGTMLAMTGKEKWELFNGILYFVIYIAGVFIFSFDKIYGLCIALLLAQVGVNIAKFIEVWVFYKQCPLDIKSVLSILIILLGNGALIFPLIFINNFWIWLIIGIAVGIALIVLNFFVFTLYRKKDFKYLINLK